MRKRWILALAIALAPAQGLAQAPADRDAQARAVEAAVQAYVDAFYRADPARAEGAVSPALAKYGVYRVDGALRWESMSYEELRQLAARLYAGESPPADAPRRVEILALAEHIASVRLTAAWGVDFILLTNEDGRWQVRHVVWQGSDAAPG